MVQGLAWSDKVLHCYGAYHSDFQHGCSYDNQVLAAFHGSDPEEPLSSQTVYTDKEEVSEQRRSARF